MQQLLQSFKEMAQANKELAAAATAATTNNAAVAANNVPSETPAPREHEAGAGAVAIWAVTQKKDL